MERATRSCCGGASGRAWRTSSRASRWSRAIAAPTRLVGWVADQSALQGALRRVSDFGLDLVSVREVADL